MRVTDLGEYDINDSDPRFVKVNKIHDKIKLKDDDLLVSRSGSLGLVSSVTNKIKNAILSSHIFKISLNTNRVTTKYLEVFFRSSLGQFQFFQKNNGGIIPEINQPALKSIKVILPDFKTQDKIAEEVKRRMQKVEQLQKEAKEVLEKAKQEVENIILGS